MSEFTGYGRTNHIDFGDYVKFPYGRSKEMHIWKVVSSFQSNTYIKPPYMFNNEPKIQSGGVVPVLNIIHCGIDETKVITVKESDYIKLDVSAHYDEIIHLKGATPMTHSDLIRTLTFLLTYGIIDGAEYERLFTSSFPYLS